MVLSAVFRKQLSVAIDTHYAGVVESEISLPRGRLITAAEWGANADRWKVAFPGLADAFEPVFGTSYGKGSQFKSQHSQVGPPRSLSCVSPSNDRPSAECHRRDKERGEDGRHSQCWRDDGPGRE